MSWSIWLTAKNAPDLLPAARAAAEGLGRGGAPPVVIAVSEVHRAVAPWPRGDAAELGLLDGLTLFAVATLADAGVPTIVVGKASPEIRELAAARIPNVAVLSESDAGVAERIVAIAARFPPAGRPRAARWAIWVTGRPGSGKTTIVGRAAAALARRGIAAHVLSLDAVRAFVPGGARRPEDDDPIHRALAYTAKRLCEAGVPVIVDATAARRAWREHARALIARFAEVQLVCPAEVCATRERAVRWGLGGERAQTALAPDIVLHYEMSLRPDATIHTDVEDPWTAAECVTMLGVRLHDATVRVRDDTRSPAR